MVSLVESLGWHEWLSKTNFSFLIGASHPKHLIQKCFEYGYSSLSINDYDGVYGIARGYRERNKLLLDYPDSRLKLHYGSEIHVEVDHDEPIYFQKTLVLMAKSHRGYFNLNRILTYARRDGKHHANVPFEYLLTSDMHDIFVVVPMRGWVRTQTLSQEDFGNLRDHVSGELYFALSRHLNAAEDHWITPTAKFANQIGCSTILSQDIFFHNEQQKRMSDLLHAIRHNKVIDEVTDQLFINQHRCPKKLDFLHHLYCELPLYKESLETAQVLAHQIQFDLNELSYSYPKEMIPKDFSSQEYLEKLTWENAKKCYPNGIPSKVLRLLQHELKLVQELKFADYFLTVYDIVSWARSQDILCQGRGSAANSSVCFVLGITAINPNQFELVFERFISAERGDPPDIDVDFEHERREEVIQYVYRRFGRAKAAMVCNVICFKSKGAMRFVGKALGFSEQLISQGSKILESREFRRSGNIETIRTLYKENQEEREHFPLRRWELWAQMSEQLKGFPRHLGIHSGGVLLSDKPITMLCPQEPATMENRTVIQWCKEDIEALGFFKIDILALGGLTMIKKSFQMLKEHYGISLSLDQIPDDDPKTYDMIQRADTIGTFQIESRAQISFLPRHKPKNFYDLVVEVAIIRPGPIQGGMIHPYLRRREGKEPVVIPDPRLEPILRRTYGIPIFQEQVMRVAIAVGGFSPGEADQLRKNIGSFNIKTNPEYWVEKLAKGMRENGMDQEFIDGIVGQIKGFASYGFPESHAASFALLAYATSYLKCHYPTVFFAAILNSQPMGFYSVDALIKTAIGLGVKILPMSVNHSEWDHHLESTDHPECYAIRLGFRLVSGLSKSGVGKFLKKRDVAGWQSLEDFVFHGQLSRLDFTALAAADAFYEFGLDRRAAVWLAEAAPYNEFLEDYSEIPKFERMTDLQKVQHDYQSVGTSLGPHPAKLMKKYAWLFSVPLEKLHSSKQLPLIGHGRHLHTFGMVTCRQSPPTAKGMVFITLWDEFGSSNIVIQPQIYAKYRDLIDRQSFLCVYGKLQKEGEACSLLVKHILEPNIQQAEVIPMQSQHKLLPAHLLSRESELVASRNYM